MSSGQNEEMKETALFAANEGVHDPEDICIDIEFHLWQDPVNALLSVGKQNCSLTKFNPPGEMLKSSSYILMKFNLREDIFRKIHP